MMKKLICDSLAALTLLAAQAEARHVFYFIGDGMGMGHVNAAERYLRDVRHSPEPLLMLGFPVASQARTYSASSPITDSAAAGTALSTGTKTVNGRIAMSTDSIDLVSISSDFARAGYNIGVVTSVAGDDATPAAFYAHALDRGMKKVIAPYAIEAPLSFLGAGNFKIFSDKEGAGDRWLADMQSEGGYTLVSTLAELRSRREKGEGRKVLFLPKHPVGDQIGYTIDSLDRATSLAEMTVACLETVDRDDKPFFMMVEGGNIDWAAHANDGGAVIKEVLNFQDAIRVAYDFYLAHPDDTLIVITADHDTGGMALGRRDNGKPDLSLIDSQRVSKDMLAEFFRDAEAARASRDGGKPMSWGAMTKLLEESFGFWKGIPLTDAETEELEKSYTETFITRRAKDEKTLYNDFNGFTTKVFDVMNRHYGIGWTTNSHTGNFVPVFAVGEGSGLFGRNLDNTEIPMEILNAAGIPRK